MKLRLWHALHVLANRAARRYAWEQRYALGSDQHPLWRLNDWLGTRWIDERNRHGPR